jgi:hypothetical protein
VRVSEPQGSQGSAPGRFPDFFLVGQPKTGTTALYEMLKRHPQIFLPELKEPHFLADELRPNPSVAPTRKLPEFLHVLPSSERGYRNLYADAGPHQIAGDGSVFYLWSATAAHNIAALRSDAKIIVIVREPVSLLHSLHMEMLQTRLERTSSFSRAIGLEESRRRQYMRLGEGPTWEKTLLYTDHARYVTQLRRYEAAVGRDQMLVLVYDDFRADNPATIRRVLQFLGVDDNAPLSRSQANPSVRVRSGAVDHLTNSLKMGRGRGWHAAQALVKLVTPTRLRRRALHFVEQDVLVAAPDTPDARTSALLREQLRPEVVALCEYLQRDLAALWGYD